MPVVRNRSPRGPRYYVYRSPPPDVYLTDVLIDIVVIWGYALRCLGRALLAACWFLGGACRGAAQELRCPQIEDEIAEVVAEIKRRRK